MSLKPFQGETAAPLHQIVQARKLGPTLGHVCTDIRCDICNLCRMNNQAKQMKKGLSPFKLEDPTPLCNFGSWPPVTAPATMYQYLVPGTMSYSLS